MVDIGGGPKNEDRRLAQRFRITNKAHEADKKWLVECAPGLRCAFAFGPFGASDHWRPGKFGRKRKRISVVNERRAVRRCAVRPSAEDPLLLDMTIARRRQGFGFANGVGRLLSVVQVAPSYVIVDSAGGLRPLSESWTTRS